MGDSLAKGFPPSLKRPGWANYSFAFHGNDEVGPGLLTQNAKKTGLRPEDLWLSDRDIDIAKHRFGLAATRPKWTRRV
jgi:hypothetical protein